MLTVFIRHSVSQFRYRVGRKWRFAMVGILNIIKVKRKEKTKGLKMAARKQL